MSQSTKQAHYVAGIDGSPEAIAGAKWAVARAKQSDAKVTLVCAYALASYSAAALDGGFAVPDDSALREGAKRAVNEAAEEIKEETGFEVETRIEVGDPSSLLVEISKSVDLIVLGSRGNVGVADRLLGGVSAALPGYAKCPTVIVPPHKSGKPFTPVERIVVGTDGSDVASNALKQAVAEAIAWDAKLTAVTAIPITSGVGFMSWLPTAVNRPEIVADVKRGLDKAIAEAVDGRQVDVSGYALDGSPAALLTEFSTAVDMVVVGTRGRGGFAGVLLGSTSQTVLEHSTCPVMTVPSRLRDKEDPTGDWERR